MAHGIEGGSKQFNHGEAVSFGIVFSMLASHIDGGLPLKTVAKVVKLLVKAKLPVDFRPFVNETILDKIWKDKKRILDKIRFVFIDRPGIVRVEAVSRDDFQKLLKEGMELLPKVYETMGELNKKSYLTASSTAGTRRAKIN